MPRKKIEKFEVMGEIIARIPAGSLTIVKNDKQTILIYDHLRDVTGDEMILDAKRFREEQARS